MGRRRVDPHLGSSVRRHAQGRDDPPHGRPQHLFGRRGPGDDAVDLRVPHGHTRLGRHRLQRDRRPLRPDVRGPLRGPGVHGDRGARRRLQQLHLRCLHARQLRHGAVPQADVDSITEIVAWKFGLYGIDPHGTTVLTSGGGGTAKYPAGQAVALPMIFGHKDVGNTVCPGKYGYGRMDEIRTDVAARLPAYDVRSVQQRNSLTGHITDVSPVLVSSVLSSNGATTVFGRGADNAIWYRTGRGVGTYSVWASIPGAIATSGPAAVSSDGTRVDVVVRGAGNAVYQASSTLDPSTGRPGTWSSWMSLGGALTTAPGIASVGANKSAIVGRGTDGAVWQRVWDGAGWSEWASLGGYAWSSPSIEADNVNGAWRYVVSVVGTDLGIWRVPTASMTARPLGSWYGTGDFSGHGLGNANTSSAYWAPKALTAGGGDHSVFLVDP